MVPLRPHMAIKGGPATKASRSTFTSGVSSTQSLPSVRYSKTSSTVSKAAIVALCRRCQRIQEHLPQRGTVRRQVLAKATHFDHPSRDLIDRPAPCRLSSQPQQGGDSKPCTGPWVTNATPCSIPTLLPFRCNSVPTNCDGAWIDLILLS